MADGHARAGFVVTPAVARADLLQLPVHAGGAVVVNLDAIHADVALAGVGVFGDDAGQRDETSAVQRPAFLDGEVEQGWEVRLTLTVSARSGRAFARPASSQHDVRRLGPRLGARRWRVELVNHFLARAVLHQLRFGVAQIERLAEQFDGFAETGRRLGFHQRAEFGGDFVHGIRAQAHGHALLRAQRVDGERETARPRR